MLLAWPLKVTGCWPRWMIPPGTQWAVSGAPLAAPTAPNSQAFLSMAVLSIRAGSSKLRSLAGCPTSLLTSALTG